MSRAVVEAVAQRIESQLMAGVPVFRGGIGQGEGDRYVVVRSGLPDPVSEDLADSQQRRDLTVWVTVVAEDSISRERAAQRCLAAAERAHEALIGWRPTTLGTAWKPVLLDSQPITRDEDYPDRFLMYVVTRWGVSHLT